MTRLNPTLPLGAALAAFIASQAVADQFHYNNVVIGTRAVGMGGAFGAVADDASGTYYNPAGLAFALSNDISGSANAFYSKKTTYKETLGSDPFIEESSGSVPSFFGGLQKLDRYVPGLVFAFGVYNVDSDLKDQDTLLENKQIKTTTIERYHRTSNARATTSYAGAAVGLRLNPAMALGLGLNYFSVDELVQEYQDAKQTTAVRLSDGSTGVGWRILGSNVREHLQVYGLQPVLGAQFALPINMALGLTVKKGIVASQTLDIASETRIETLSSANKEELGAGNATSAVVSESVVQEKVDKPIGEWPMEVRASWAWFASPTFMWAIDIISNSKVSSAKAFKANGDKPKYNREAVLNWATGVEWYVAAAFPLRFGMFSNNDARPKIKEGTPDPATSQTCSQDKAFRDSYCGQPDHIDYLGGSLFIGWVQPNSQITVGFVRQQGKGKAQKLGDHQVQTVDATSNTFGFSATHNL